MHVHATEWDIFTDSVFHRVSQGLKCSGCQVYMARDPFHAELSPQPSFQVIFLVCVCACVYLTLCIEAGVILGCCSSGSSVWFGLLSTRVLCLYYPGSGITSMCCLFIWSGEWTQALWLVQQSSQACPVNSLWLLPILCNHEEWTSSIFQIWESCGSTFPQCWDMKPWSPRRLPRGLHVKACELSQGHTQLGMFRKQLQCHS